jgi:hypothetical protein
MLLVYYRNVYLLDRCAYGSRKSFYAEILIDKALKVCGRSSEGRGRCYLFISLLSTHKG